jgi:hypothetical protein
MIFIEKYRRIFFTIIEVYIKCIIYNILYTIKIFEGDYNEYEN